MLLKNFFIIAFFSFFMFSNLYADENTFTFTLGNYKVSSLIISKMEHPKNLFRYDNKKQLEKYLNQENANLSAINVFLVNMGKTKILFDAGTDPDVLIERLAEINIQPEDINFICITHTHFDHIGGLVKNNAKVFPNAEIYISKEELEANPNLAISSVYHDSIKTFKQNDVIINNIKTIPAFGHTAGHTAFLVSSRYQNMLVWGDMLHAVVQFENYNIYMTYDKDPQQVIALRKNILEQYSNGKYYIAGAHLVYPGIGKIEKTKTGYKFIPLEKTTKKLPLNS